MDLYDLLACPHCKVALERHAATLTCLQCRRSYPIINNVPVLMPDGTVPAIQHEHELNTWKAYAPWIHRVVLQSLPPSAIILELGSGNMALDLPNVIRTDVTLTPYVDVVCDAHALPFLPGSLDFIFALAVIEHLRQPFVAADQIYGALRSGGYLYGECNFVFAYHGYPHHYFNASQQGLEQVFAEFTRLRSGVAPYQMPSFALSSVLGTYLHDLGLAGEPDVRRVHTLINRLLALPLITYDKRFSEEAALRTAAGVYFFGMKAATSDAGLVPAAAHAAWQQSPELQQRFPAPLDLGVADNLLRWAASAGRAQDQAIAAQFDAVAPFYKRAGAFDEGLTIFAAFPVVEPTFGNVPWLEHDPPPDVEEQLRAYAATLEATIRAKDQHIGRLEALIKRLESGRVMRLLRRFRR